MPLPPAAAVEPGQLFESIVVNANDVVLVTEASPVDLASGGPRVIYVNPAFTRMTGYSPAEIVGQTPRLLQSPKTDRAELDRVRAALAAWEPVEVELLNVHKDGTEFWVQINITPVRNAAGRVTHWVAVQRDITARKTRDLAARALLDNSSDLVMMVDPAGRLGSVSPTATRILGLDPAALNGAELSDLLHPEDCEVLRSLLAPSGGAPGNRPNTGELRLRHGNGDWRWLQVAVLDLGAAALRSDDARDRVLTCCDITENKAVEEALSLANDRFRSALLDAPIGMALTDPSGRLLQVNAALCELLGRTRDELIQRSLDEFVHPDDVEASRIQRHALLHGSLTRHRHESRFLDADGETVAVLHSSSVVPGRDGQPQHLVDHIEDITERKGFEDQLRHLALHDPLTSLPNRALLTDRLQRALGMAARRGTSVAVLFVDLDRFKVVNDTFGHQAGDSILLSVAGRLVSVLRPGDTVARYGGDEFIVVCEESTVEEAAKIAVRINAVLSEPFSVHGDPITVTASIGAAMSGPGGDVDALLRDADVAMYSAKDKGRARFEAFDPVLGARTAARIHLEGDLRHAIDNDGLRLHFQPVIRLGDSAVVGAEALLRWEHPVRGLLPPGEFIGIAEDSGLIHPMGDWVLAEAIHCLVEWRPGERPGPVLWLNLSARQIAEADFAARVGALVEQQGVPPSRLGFEVTESVLMAETGMSSKTLKSLQELGFLIAIDNFGTGYSSLAYRQDFPVDTVKIDRSFVAGLDKDNLRRGSFAIVGAVIGLAHALNLRVVGEGVETAGQAQALHGLGCDLAQGFLYGRPVRDLP